MNTDKLTSLLELHAEDVKDPYVIFELAKEYDHLKQGAAAVGLYIKSADLTDDKDLQYKCMVLAGNCYRRQGNRSFTTFGMYQDAVIVQPDRPEAHHCLASYHESRAEWKQCLMHARLGLYLARDIDDFEEDEFDLGYPGKDWFYIQEAASLWGLSGNQTGRDAFFDIGWRKDVVPGVRADAQWKLTQMIGIPDCIYYEKECIKTFKYPFEDIEQINKNNSKHFQDMFVLAVFNGKRNGTYVEIGSGHPIVHNNTYQLEQRGWKGLSIDSNKALCYDFSLQRKNTCLCLDATDTDFKGLFNMHSMSNTIDYLQIDCDEKSLEILHAMPFKTHKFNVITFEHDSYRLGTDIRDEARELLKKEGYTLLVNDISFWNDDYPYEDWYVHSSLLNERVLSMASTKDVNFVWDYFYED